MILFLKLFSEHIVVIISDTMSIFSTMIVYALSHFAVFSNRLTFNRKELPSDVLLRKATWIS